VGSKVRSVRIGDFVACAGAGYAHHADLVCVPEHLTAKVSPAYLKPAAVTTIGAIALQGIRQAELKIGETVCVIGLGLLGQLTIQLAKKAGCRVIGIDLIPDRLELAMKLGADHVYHPEHDRITHEVNLLTERHGVDATIITAAAKHDTIIQQAMELTRKRGKVVLVGDVQIKFDRMPFYAKEIDFRISCSYGPGRYDSTYEQQGIDYPYAYVRWTEQRNMQAFIHLLQKGEIDISMLVTREVTLDTVAQAYKDIREQYGLGMLIAYDRHEVTETERSAQAEQTDAGRDAKASCALFMPAKKDCMRVGVIGVGGFAKVTLLPTIAKMSNITISALADTNNIAALNSAKSYAIPRCYGDYTQLIAEDAADIVVVASPHKFHAAQAIHALAKGKAVFLEQPMATDRNQLGALHTALKQYAGIPFCVDYNRSFAPFIRKIKGVLEKRTGPLMLHYRMNAFRTEKDCSQQAEIGSGRIIAEACHIIDLFFYVTGARARSVSVEAMHSGNEHIFPTDNFSAHISFDDGSVCSLLYTSVGHSGLAKERMELFFDGKAIVMDDYRTLKGYGIYPGFDEVDSFQDKGHSALLQSFFDACRAARYVPPIPYDRLERIADLTLVIDKLVCQGGGSQDVM
jgi:predicted dehydrogenase/threonine dehydrogenase-like Zn-dependent dehydrogenase